MKDLLLEYDDTEIEYDDLGNPLNWVDDQELTWADGRRLVGYSDVNKYITFAYNADGLRVEKDIDNGFETHTYFYNGSQLAVDEWTCGNTTCSLHFIYDASG